MRVAAIFAVMAITQATASAQTTSAPQAPATRLDEIVVTASPLGRSAFDLAQPVSVLSGNALQLKLQPTLGDTLNGEPGIAASHFTNGASRPIIRGLTDNRVLILQNGTDIFDVSNLSPDHTPSVSPILSQKIEVVRGPATILYGSSAIGGVVNVIDNRIATQALSKVYEGELDSRYYSADTEFSGAFSISFMPINHLVLHADGSLLTTDDVHIPGYALTPAIQSQLSPEQLARGNAFGGNPKFIVPNTRVNTKDIGFGGSWVWDKGFAGVSFEEFASYYGVPDDPQVDDPVVMPDPVHITASKQRYDFHGGVQDPFPYFKNADLKFSYNDYKHEELDGTSVGSTFTTDGFDSRLELVHEPIGPVSGSLGAQLSWHYLSILGADAFLQPTNVWQGGLFDFEEVRLATLPLRFQIGGRVEINNTSISTDDPSLTSLTSSSQQSQTFVPLSVAAGAIYDFQKDCNAALTLRYSERAPTPEELFARGPHDATFQYLIGDPSVGLERVLGADLSVRKKDGIVTGSVGGFYNYFFNYIESTPTAQFVDDLQVFPYEPKQANFLGAEAVMDIHLLPRNLTRTAQASDDKSVKSVITGESDEPQPNPNDLYLEGKCDYVYAQNLTDNSPLPYMPPFRYTFALAYQGAALGARIELMHAVDQERVPSFETTTPGYTFLNASVNYTFGLGPTTCSVYVQGSNLLNQTARESTSYLKDVLPLPGAGVSVGVKMTF
jgi:iron complex outermembrane receptor protein